MVQRIRERRSGQAPHRPACRQAGPGQLPNSLSGQVILVTIIAITGTLIGALTIGGLLTLYQLRQAGDLTRSAQSIFAADAGIEWGLYQFFQPTSTLEAPTFINGAEVETQCSDAIDEPYPGFSVICADTSSTLIQAFGTSAGTRRSLELYLVVP